MNYDKTISQRQIPKKIETISNKLYGDNVYGYLQYYCELENIPGSKDKKKIIYKNNLNFSAMGRDLGMTRQTAAKKVKNLVTMGLLKEEEKHYELITLPSEDAFLVAHPTLRILINTMRERTISLYVYLLNRYIANGEKPFEFSITGLRGFLGMSTSSRGNNGVITDILEILKQLKLIDYVIFTTNEEGTGHIKTIYKLTYATNALPS